MGNKKRKQNGHWTEERCAAEAKKYKTRIKFKKINKKAWESCRKKSWYQEICKHMKKKVKRPKATSILYLIGGSISLLFTN